MVINDYLAFSVHVHHPKKHMNSKQMTVSSKMSLFLWSTSHQILLKKTDSQICAPNTLQDRFWGGFPRRRQLPAPRRCPCGAANRRYGFSVPVTVPWAELDLDHVISAGQADTARTRFSRAHRRIKIHGEAKKGPLTKWRESF